MASEKAPYTSLLLDREKCDLNQNDLFDKVVNLKLTVSSIDANDNSVKSDEYVVRSDYETYFPSLMKSVAESDLASIANSKVCYVRKCQYKPAIKVAYKRVSMSTPVEIDISIGNFFMLDKSGKMLKSLNNITNRLTKVELAMGYFPQFEAMLGGRLAEITPTALFNFDSTFMAGHGITLLTMSNVEYVQTDKLPPDMVVHIHGYVGNLYADSLGTLKLTNPTYNSLKGTEIIIDSSKNTSGASSFIAQVFFEALTSRYLRIGTLDKAITTVLESEISATGKMSVANAKKYGVLVSMSSAVKSYASTYDKDKKASNSSGTKGRQVLTIPRGSGQKTALQTVNLIFNMLGLEGINIIEVPTDNSLLLIMQDEVYTPDSVLTGTSVEVSNKIASASLYWKDKLPAVYNITTDAICTISCPFFFYLSPFQKFYFKTRYALGGMVSYYANFNATEDEFYALWQTVAFSTTGDENECEIVCTGKRKA